MGAEVFINYRGAADSLYAAAVLYAGLAQALGPDKVFLDSESIKPGTDFVTTLLDQVSGARVVLAVIGPHWLTAKNVNGQRRIDDPDDWIRRELATAFSAGVLVIPVLTDNAAMPTEADLPTDIARLGRAQYVLLRQRHAQSDIDLLLAKLIDLISAVPGVTRNDERDVARQRSTGTTEQRQVAGSGIRRHQDPVPQVVPRQLPAAPSHFTGRENELADLDRAVCGDDSTAAAPSVVVVTGPGGVGKTALALHWLYARAERFPDGQLYADLSAYRADGPTEIGALLGSLLRAMRVPVAEIPFAVEDRAALFRSVTTQLAVGMLLDDVITAGQVRALLPASSRSVVLVTSRRRLTGLAATGARVVVLAPLLPPAAVDMLTKTVGIDRINAEPHAAWELAALCCGVPIALRVMAARLVTRPRLRLAQAVHDLTDERHRLMAMSLADDEISVEACLDLSYRELSPEAAQLYRRLALHPGAEFSSCVTAAAVGLPVEQTVKLLDTLVEASMVVETGDDRYRFHDLLRLHARHRAHADDPEPERQAAVLAMVRWYLDESKLADAVITPLRWRLDGQRQWRTNHPAYENATQALDWLARELPNLLAAQRVAFEHGWDTLAWELCDALWGLFLYRGYYREWHAAGQLGVRAAGRVGNRAAESRLRAQVAASYMRLGLYGEAEPWCWSAWKRAIDAKDWRCQATALESLGSVAHSLGRLDKAIDYYRRSLAINEEHHQVRGVGMLLCYLGYALSDQGDYADAARSFHRSAQLSESIGDHNSRALALAGIGTTYAKQGRFDLAIAELTSGLSLLSVTTAPSLLVDVLEKIGEASRKVSDFVAARQHWSKATDILCGSDDPREQHIRTLLQSLPDRPSPP
jgi:tetratricopeptide (TPR) repeat protein